MTPSTPPLLLLLATAPLSAPSAQVPGDFDGDGFGDLVICAPSEDVNGVADAGAVTVLYGSATGVSTAGAQLWHQDVPGVPGGTEPEDRFGDAVAVGDFDGDGYADLAIGTPSESLGTMALAGMVSVLYGGPGGLSASGAQNWTQDSSGVPGADEPFNRFGAALAAGDFDGDGRDDLVIGVPNEDIGSVGSAGSIVVLRGSSSGLTSSGSISSWAGQGGVPGTPTALERLGEALATGDFDGDGRDDLAVGVPGRAHGGTDDVGSVLVFRSTPGPGLSFTVEELTPGADGLAGASLVGDSFGQVLASGDLTGDGYDDLVVGSPERSRVVGPEWYQQVGGVTVVFGGPAGLAPASGLFLWQDDFFDPGEQYDRFGESVAIGDFDGDGAADLLVGAPGEDSTKGVVNIALGRPLGILPVPFAHRTPPDIALFGNRYGQAIASGDFDGNGLADFAIAAPGFLGYGGVEARSLTFNRAFWQNTPGVPDANQTQDRWGSRMASR